MLKKSLLQKARRQNQTVSKLCPGWVLSFSVPSVFIRSQDWRVQQNYLKQFNLQYFVVYSNVKKLIM